MFVCPWRPKEDVRLLEAEVIGRGKPPNMDVRNQASGRTLNVLNHLAILPVPDPF